jgi:hypothetical protein
MGHKKVVNGSHNVLSVWGQEGATLGVGMVLLLWPSCLGVGSHRVLGQFCQKIMIVQYLEVMLFHVIFGREVKNVALGRISHNLFNEGNKGASFQGQEGLWSGVGRVSLLWPCVGFRIMSSRSSSAVRQIETKRVESRSIVSGSHEMTSPSNKERRIRASRCQVIHSQRFVMANNLWWMAGGGCVGV